MIDYIKYESLIEDKLIELKQIGLNTKVFNIIHKTKNEQNINEILLPKINKLYNSTIKFKSSNKTNNK